MRLALVFLASCALQTDLDMALVDHGVLVNSSRQWTQGLTPNAAGNGWNYIAASWPGGPGPVEWAVIKNITTSPSQAVYQTTAHNYPNSTIGYGTGKGQLRAPNGRIFWPLFANNIAYYDPTTEAISTLPSIVETPPIDPNASTEPYSATFDHNGIIYMATQESQKRPSMVFSLDPVSLTTTVLGYVGSNTNAYTTYGYRIAADTTGVNKFIYVAYGEDPWQLWALNITPGPNYGIATKLYEVTATGNISFAEIIQTGTSKGWTAIIDTDLGKPDNVRTQWWCLDGALYAYTVNQAPPNSLARVVTPASNPLVSPPIIDYSGGIGVVGWKPAGSAASVPYTIVNYSVSNRDPVPIESLVASSDGICGNAINYNGIITVKQSGAAQWFGPLASGMAEGQYARVSVGNAVYFSGYPNGVLFKFDTSLSYNLNASPANPQNLGNFGLQGTQFEGTKYERFMVYSPATHRLYSIGDRGRNGVGMGVGYYDVNTLAFVGEYSTADGSTGPAALNQELSSGLVVDDTAGLVVVSTQNIPGINTDAVMYVFSQDLSTVNSAAPLPGKTDLGKIFPTSTPGVVCGVLQGSNNSLALYKFNANTRTLISYTETNVIGTLGPMTRLPTDGSIWVMSGNNLVKVDPNALTAIVHDDMTAAAPVSVISFGSDNQTLWMAGGYATSSTNTQIAGARLFSQLIQFTFPSPPARGTWGQTAHHASSDQGKASQSKSSGHATIKANDGRAKIP